VFAANARGCEQHSGNVRIKDASQSRNPASRKALFHHQIRINWDPRMVEAGHVGHMWCLFWSLVVVDDALEIEGS